MTALAVLRAKDQPKNRGMANAHLRGACCPRAETLSAEPMQPL